VVIRPPRGPVKRRGCRVVPGRVEAPLDERADLVDERDCSRPLALGAFVDEAARAWRGLTPDGPGPGAGVDVGAADARYLADAGRGARREDDDLAPAAELIS
jgi:hypothetical protein